MEIGFDDEVPDSLVVELPDGKILDVGIEYLGSLKMFALQRVLSLFQILSF